MATSQGILAAIAAAEVESPARRAWRRRTARKGAMVALALLVLIVVAAVFAPYLAPHDPIQQSWRAVRQAPS
ncbi:hypothetical protein ABTD92_21080, partial [Acinetobacter baumannii]